MGKQVCFDVFAGLLHLIVSKQVFLFLFSTINRVLLACVQEFLAKVDMKISISILAAFFTSIVACLLSQVGP
jgi:hypothetical protein